MAYVLGGPNNEADGFTTAIASFALRAMHESIGLVNMTNVVTPTQGNEFLVPNFAPITYQDYNSNSTAGTWGTGNANVQNPALGQGSITATPAVASTACCATPPARSSGLTPSSPAPACCGRSAPRAADPRAPHRDTARDPAGAPRQ